MRQFITSNVSERITDGVAIGAVSSPLWLDTFMSISSFFGAMLPIMGCGWIAIQIYYHFKKQKDKNDGV